MRACLRQRVLRRMAGMLFMSLQAPANPFTEATLTVQHWSCCIGPLWPVTTLV